MSGKKNFDIIFERLRENENREVELTATTKQLVSLMQDFKNKFESHDQNEMKKYAEINDSINAVNTRLTNITSKIEHIENSSEQKEMRCIEKVKMADDKAIEALKLARESKDIITKWGGGLAMLMIISSLMYFVYAEMKEQKNKLEDKLYEYEKHQAMNYARQQAIIGAKE